MTCTLDMLQGVLQDSIEDSDTWSAAEKVASLKQSSANGLANLSEAAPIDQDNSSLEMESSYLMRTGQEPTNDEILEYLEKHKLQAFMTEVIMHVARHLPLDPFQFLLNHIEAMVMKYLAAQGVVKEDGQPPPAPPSPARTQGSPEQAEKVVKRIATVLQHPELTQASAIRFWRQFAKHEDKMVLDSFQSFLKHLEKNWGLLPEDTKFMLEVLRRWRFRVNGANGTRGLPLWPLTREDFLSAFSCLLRAVRDRYVPIGAIHRSVFIRQMQGTLKDRYDIGSRLGRGAYGEVLLVVLKETQEKRVCKRIFEQNNKVPQEEVASEVDLLRSLDHPHIIRIFEYFQDDDRYISIIMEPVFGGTLTHIVDGLYLDKEGEPLGVRPAVLTESWVAAVIAQILSALVYAHEVVGVIHKDLKLDNVLLVGPPKLKPEEMLKQPIHAMLADFGIAEVFGSTSAEKVVRGNSNMKNRSSRVGGTPTYMSPEMFQGSFSEKCDIWSLGVMFYKMMSGELPYKADNLLMQANIVSNPRRHPRWELLSTFGWSHGARRLCQQLLTKDEGMRPSASQALKSGWIMEMKSSQQSVGPMDASSRGALQQIQMQSHLMRMAMHCITSQLNLSQLHTLNVQFKQYDSTGDGRLSVDEMKQVLDDTGIDSSEDKDLIVQAMDSDHSGKIEYSEFITGCLDLGLDNIRSQIPVVFSIFDLDNSGGITLEELRLILTQGANDKRPATLSSTSSSVFDGSMTMTNLLPDGLTVEQVMKSLDVDKNGKVDCFEFERYLLQEHERLGNMLAVSRPGTS